MSQSGGFDLSKLSTASKILLGAGIVYVIDIFLPWNKVDTGFAGCCSVSGTHGLGILNLLLAIALVAWEVMAVMGVDIKGAPRALVSAGLAGAILVLTILKILIDLEFIFIFAWIGLILAAAIGYGGWMRWQEHQAGASSAGGGAVPPPPTGGGGFSS